MCTTVLTNEAAQVMANGDHLVGAMVGIVMLVLAPLSLFARRSHRKRKNVGLVKECPLAAKPDLPTGDDLHSIGFLPGCVDHLLMQLAKLCFFTL